MRAEVDMGSLTQGACFAAMDVADVVLEACASIYAQVLDMEEVVYRVGATLVRDQETEN